MKFPNHENADWQKFNICTHIKLLLVHCFRAFAPLKSFPNTTSTDWQKFEYLFSSMKGTSKSNILAVFK